MTPIGLPPGTILGAFEIVSTLGRGGMGAVYAARNRITGDVRAVKVILPELAARPEFVGRFVREIRMAMAVEHPHLVRVFEPAMHGELIFLPMELLQGESLSSFLRRQRSVGLEATDNLVQAIGSAVVALHARGILHRDVKPSNIFLAQDRGIAVPKLLDLGAGKDVEGDEEHTSAGLAVGSPHYMAPEQAAGRRDLDGRVDQYALAVVAYQLMTGARPYENDDTGHVLAKVLSGAPYKSPRELLGTIPPQLEEVILRGMARTREERYPMLADFLGAFHVASVAARGAAFEPVRNLPTVQTRAPGSGGDPSGTVQTGVGASARSRSLVGAALGIAGGVLTVVLGLVVVRVLASPAVPATAATSALPATASPASATPPAPSAPAAVAASPPPAPSAAPSALPSAEAPAGSVASAAPTPPASASATAPTPAPVAADEINPTPPPRPAPTPPPAAVPVAVAPPAATPAPPPPPVAVPRPSPPPPVAVVAAPAEPKPVVAPRPPSPSPRPASRPAPGGAAPCKSSPGSPCL